MSEWVSGGRESGSGSGWGSGWVSWWVRGREGGREEGRQEWRAWVGESVSWVGVRWVGDRLVEVLVTWGGGKRRTGDTFVLPLATEVVESNAFEYITGVLILANIGLIGVEALWAVNASGDMKCVNSWTDKSTDVWHFTYDIYWHMLRCVVYFTLEGGCTGILKERSILECLLGSFCGVQYSIMFHLTQTSLTETTWSSYSMSSFKCKLMINAN